MAWSQISPPNQSCPTAIDEMFNSRLHVIGGVGIGIGVVMVSPHPEKSNGQI